MSSGWVPSSTTVPWYITAMTSAFWMVESLWLWLCKSFPAAVFPKPLAQSKRNYILALDSVPLPRSSVITSTRLLRANFFLRKERLTEKFEYWLQGEYFVLIKLLITGGIKCKCKCVAGSLIPLNWWLMRVALLLSLGLCHFLTVLTVFLLLTSTWSRVFST